METAYGGAGRAVRPVRKQAAARFVGAHRGRAAVRGREGGIRARSLLTKPPRQLPWNHCMGGGERGSWGGPHPAGLEAL